MVEVPWACVFNAKKFSKSYGKLCIDMMITRRAMQKRCDQQCCNTREVAVYTMHTLSKTWERNHYESSYAEVLTARRSAPFCLGRWTWAHANFDNFLELFCLQIRAIFSPIIATTYHQFSEARLHLSSSGKHPEPRTEGVFHAKRATTCRSLCLFVLCFGSSLQVLHLRCLWEAFQVVIEIQ